jgi:hypothetical protein
VLSQDLRERLLAGAAARHPRFTMDLRGERSISLSTTGPEDTFLALPASPPGLPRYLWHDDVALSNGELNLVAFQCAPRSWIAYSSVTGWMKKTLMKGFAEGLMAVIAVMAYGATDTVPFNGVGKVFYCIRPLPLLPRTISEERTLMESVIARK